MRLNFWDARIKKPLNLRNNIIQIILFFLIAWDCDIAWLLYRYLLAKTAVQIPPIPNKIIKEREKMVNGNIRYTPIVPYEDYASLKKYIGSNMGRKYDHAILNRFSFTQDGTGSEVEISEKGGLTITDKGKTELTIVGAMSANDDDYDDAIATLVYKDADGDEHTATCIINTTDSTTETAFNDLATGLVPVTDYYEPVSLSLSVPVKSGHTFGMGTTGVLTYGVIREGETSAVDEDMLGVGTVYARYSNDDASYQGEVMYVSYINNLGEIEYGYFHTDKTDATTEVKLYKGILDSTGFTNSDWNIPNIITHVTPTTIPVRNFWRLRTLDISVTPGSGHYFVICNSDMSEIYNVVEEGNYESYHSRYTVPTDCESWVTHIAISQSVITSVVSYVTIYYTPLGETHEHKVILSVANNAISQFDPVIPIKPGTEVKFTIIGNLAKVTIDIHILEATNK